VILRAVEGPLVDFDVRAGTGSLMYRADGGAWTTADGLAIAGAPGWYSRYRVRLPDATRVEMIPLAVVPAGRLFDHNRQAGDYILNSPFQFIDDGVCLDRAQPRARLDFNVGYTTKQAGALVRGGHLTVNYAQERLTNCRATHNGYRFWSLDANVKFQPSGLVSTGTLVASNGPAVSSVPFDAEIPDGTTSAELWFHNYSPGECDAWDSNFGQNYHFSVGGQTAQVGWLGDWGSSTSRECTHQPGVLDPIVVDEYARERACLFVDGDVWVPGAEDHPEWIFAQVEWQKDAQPVVVSDLDFVSRVGNNSRFRWQFPYEIRNQNDWSTAKYRFKFSTDGNSFSYGPYRSISHAQ
jgi:hypothetical protein